MICRQLPRKVNNEKWGPRRDIPTKNDPVTPAEDTWPYYHPRHPLHITHTQPTHWPGKGQLLASHWVACASRTTIKWEFRADVMRVMSIFGVLECNFIVARLGVSTGSSPFGDCCHRTRCYCCWCDSVLWWRHLHWFFENPSEVGCWGLFEDLKGGSKSWEMIGCLKYLETLFKSYKGFPRSWIGVWLLRRYVE